MKTNRHRTFWLASLLGLAVLLFANQAAQAQAVRGLMNVDGKWSSGTPMFAAGDRHTCALTGDGVVRCWGDNGSGQLGDGTFASRNTPGVVTGVLTDAVAIAAGQSHSCGLRANGRVMCWGNNFNGQVGDGSNIGSRGAPVTVLRISNAVSIDAASATSCAVLASGQINCWGQNRSGNLGDGTTTDSTFPVTVLGINNAVSVLVGSRHTCALLASGQIMCWGENGNGQLGDGTTINRSSPVTVLGINNAVSVSAGSRHTCALLSTGQVVCWGRNDLGQLGDGNTVSSRPMPVAVSGINNAVSITPGTSHTCALLASGQAMCWGGNDKGQLGDGSTLNRLTPVPVNGLTHAIVLRAGERHTCALITPTRSRCWGANENGQLGDGSRIDSSVPVTTALTRSISAGEVASGGGHSCAVRVDGTLSCWGSNLFGQLGNGTEITQLRPVAVSGLNTVVSVALGDSHSCALLADGRVACWGNNASGQVAAGLVSKQIRPIFVPADRFEFLSGVKQVAAGFRHTCVVLVTGGVRCWGGNESGQLGDGSRVNRPQPVAVPGIEDAVELQLGDFHSCARLASGAVRCWGKNDLGQLGDGSTTDRLTPAPVNGLTNAIALAAGGGHTCALQVGGVARCWGANASGQLGDGTNLSSPFPVPVSGLAGVTAITTGTVHTCAVLSDGAAYCWGSNLFGQLGDRSAANRSLPVRVLESTRNLGSVAGISAGSAHTCAFSYSGLSKGAPMCWGRNSSGELGNGNTMNTNFAAEVPSFRFNIDPAVVLRSSPRSATVTALIDCPAKEVVRIQATLRQDGVEGTATGTKTCKGYLHRYPLKVTARNKGRFIEGSGVVEATGVVKKRGQVTDTQNWTRNVQVSSTVAVP